MTAQKHAETDSRTISLADEESVKPPLANPEDITIPRCVGTGDEAMAVIREHREK